MYFFLEYWSPQRSVPYIDAVSAVGSGRERKVKVSTGSTVDYTKL